MTSTWCSVATSASAWPDLSADLPADPLVDFVEDEGRDPVVLRHHHLQREHQPGQLPPDATFWIGWASRPTLRRTVNATLSAPS